MSHFNLYYLDANTNIRDKDGVINSKYRIINIIEYKKERKHRFLVKTNDK